MQVDIFAKRRLSGLLFAAFLAAAAILSASITQFDAEKSFTSIPKAISWGLSSFYPDAASFEKLPDILAKLFDTVLLSIAAAVTGAAFAMIFAFAGSWTTAVNGLFSAAARSVATLFRNIDTAVWTMILLFSFGQSAYTGCFALFFGSFGFLTRAFIETIDETGSGPVEGLKAAGAGYFHIAGQAVIPSCLPQMVSWVLFMIETNIRNATLVGILTGTGIGQAFNLYYKSMNYSTASLVVLAIIAAILLLELLSNAVRRAIL